MSKFISSFQKVLGLGICGLLLLTAACAELKKVSLDDREETSAASLKSESIALVVEPVIFSDDVTDMWGLEKTVCKEASLNKDVTYKGKAAVKVSWDRGPPGCDWAGIGIGWDSYAGKDLSGIIDFAAVEMYVRSVKGKMFSLPIVLTLEDYSGGMAFCYTGNKFFERPFIDEEWQKVVVPLNSFDMEIKNLNPTSIKQLILELQQSGSIYLDEIKLVPYEPQPIEPWLKEEPLGDPLAMPIQLFDDAFINNNGWGLITDDCQNFKISTTEPFEGENAIHAKWNDPSGTCRHVTIGVSWHKWNPVDISSIVSNVAVRFDLKTASGTFDQLPVMLAFEDYERANSNAASLVSSYVKSGKFTSQWQEVTVPFSAFNTGIDQTNVKQLLFKFAKSGEVYIDNIRLVNQ